MSHSFSDCSLCEQCACATHHHRQCVSPQGGLHLCGVLYRDCLPTEVLQDLSHFGPLQLPPHCQYRAHEKGDPPHRIQLGSV